MQNDDPTPNIPNHQKISMQPNISKDIADGRRFFGEIHYKLDYDFGINKVMISLHLP